MTKGIICFSLLLASSILYVLSFRSPSMVFNLNDCKILLVNRRDLLSCSFNFGAIISIFISLVFINIIFKYIYKKIKILFIKFIES